MTDQIVGEGEKPEELTYAEQFITENQYEEALKVLIELEKKKNIPLTHIVSCLTLQARILTWLGRFEDATKKCEQAYEESLGLVKSLQILHPLILKALIYNWQGKFDKSFETIKKSEDLFRTFDKESSIQSEYIVTEALLNFIKGYLVSQKDPNKGLELLEYSLSLWDSVVDLRIEKAMTIMCIGMVLYSSKGELDQSINQLKKALAIAEKINHKWGIAHLKTILGNSYYLKGEINQSLNYYQNALQLFKEINNKVQMAYSYSNIGGIMAEKGEFEQALKNIENSLAIFKEIGLIYGMFIPLVNIIEITLEMGDMEKTNMYFNNIKQIDEQFKRPALNLFVVLIEAIILKKKQRTRDNAKAEEMFKQILEKSDISFSITIEALIHLSDLYLTELRMTNNPEILDDIAPLAEKLLRITEKSNSFWILGETYLLQAKLALLSLDLKGARRFLTQGQQIAEKFDLTLLARKISNEHDELLKQESKWENLKEKEAPLADRIELSHLNEQIESLVKKRRVFPLKLEVEQPISLIILTKKGEPLLFNHFTADMEIDNKHLVEFLSSYNIYCNQIFSETFDRIKLGQYTILINAVDSFIVCYLFQGQTYGAQQKMKHFSETLNRNTDLIEKFESAQNEGNIIQVENNPSIEELIIESFMSDPSKFQMPFKAYKGDEPFVFASYAHADKLEVYPIIDYLNKNGIKIWYDEGISVSENWKKSIAENLERSKTFLVFISPHIIDSEYVRKEISFALKKKKLFFAIHLKETKLPTELEFEIADIQAMMKFLMPKNEFFPKLKEILLNSLNK